jgi:transcriptional regulator with XRE-family HTH domain
MDKFGKLIYKRRKELGLTQETLATELSICKSYLSKIEKGRTGSPPTPQLITKIAERLGFNCDELLYLSGRITDEDLEVLTKIVMDNYEIMPKFLRILRDDPQIVTHLIVQVIQNARNGLT